MKINITSLYIALNLSSIETGPCCITGGTFPTRGTKFSFIGSLDWMPNQEGLVWFLDEVWEKIQKQFPEMKLHIAGRNTPDWILAMKKKNVIIIEQIVYEM